VRGHIKNFFGQAGIVPPPHLQIASDATGKDTNNPVYKLTLDGLQLLLINVLVRSPCTSTQAAHLCASSGSKVVPVCRKI